ncbi:peptidase C15 [Leptolyngbyaceae cyanobacterium CCMR0082]|uniref:Peptidase C15 n=2 Tax=Adonisia turfae TaxID=2950184 RepID=A0A6M0SET6_9CYAN|nr:peptidase C15 [Adonisia turfae]MDV3350238.1 peptidase C15 [Leptothoe sp. LEGE 181152]NEZ58329.1 peptidase C15 [Adonisia turfae CCMR0081]NEZ66511.1 peptidase C15 [Adonisia turfae CCMR0082]
MSAPILITSFRPWKAHQGLNTSDVLLERVAAKLPQNAIFLRWLPVNFDLAPMQVINHIVQYRPKAVICCGMAEMRQTLTVEQWGTHGDNRLATPIDLKTLIKNTIHTHISNDAGNFVCNRLYYRVLRHLKQQSAAALFVHVPLITPANHTVIEFDFLKIVDHLNSAC